MIGSAEFQKKRLRTRIYWAGTRLGEASYTHRGKVWPSSAGVEVFDKTTNGCMSWMSSVAGPTSVGIGVEFRPTRFAAKRSASTFYRVFSGFLVKEFCYET